MEPSMEIAQLAAQTAAILAPFLPFLIKGGKAAAMAAFEQAGAKFTDSLWNQAETLWKKIWPKATSKPDAQSALERAAQKPEEKRAGILELQFEDLFDEDASLAQFAGTIIKGGDDSIVVGGNAEKNIFATGQAQVTIHNYPAPPAAKKKAQKDSGATTPRSVDELREAYLNGIVNDCKRARLAGLDPQAADVTRGAFSLDRLYVSLDTKTPADEKERSKERNPLERQRPLSALEVVCGEKECKSVLIGLPGSGKSTFVRYLGLWHARALLDSTFKISERLPEWKGDALIPVIVPLGRLAESLPKGVARGKAEYVEEFIRQSLQAERDFAPALFEQAMDDGALFLFDGLDEVADLELRPIVVQAVEEFSSRYSKNKNSRFLVTCRTFSYTDPCWKITGWPTHELAPLTRKKISEFVEYWHNECINLDPAREADYQEKRRKLHAALQEGDHRRLWEIADNPLILTVMAVVHTHKGDLPDARALVYEDCIDVLLIRWEAERVVTGKSQRRDLRTALDVPDITLKNALQEIAYHAHERKPDGKREQQAALVTEDLLRADLFAAFNDEAKVQTFLDYCESANGLLMLQGVAPLPDAPPDSPERRVYAFPHLTFEEYLAARYLRRMKNLGHKTQEHLHRSDRWREVVMLLGEHICFKEGDYELMDSILHTLAPASSAEEATDEEWRSRWMAGDLLILYRRAFPQRVQAHEHLPAMLARLVEQNALAPRERASAADTLARLSDPRPGVLNDFVFCQIPAGTFLMGNNKKDDADAYDDEQPRFKYDKITHLYFISRYPITNAQFDEFVQDPEGYKNEGWWTQAGLEWRGNRAAPDQRGGVFDLPNHPVVYVTWYESYAFTRWLTHRFQVSGSRLQVWRKDKIESLALEADKWEIRLPSEAEWEKAARTEDGRKYPWGKEITPNHANYDQTGIGTTSAVGCFPAGTNEFGVLDMSGNVWEWCVTKSVGNYKNYGKTEDNDPQGTFARVLRGGAFYCNDRSVRCACRYFGDPVDRSLSIGFRVGVVSSPISLTHSGS